MPESEQEITPDYPYVEGGEYSSWDPTKVGTTSFGPGTLSNAPSETDPHPATDLEMSEAQEPLPEFDPKWRSEFEGLLYLGALRKNFRWLGHEFQIRTVTVGELMEIGLIHKEYVGTLAEIKAYQAAVIAACVEKVDGRPISIPVSNEDSVLRDRFRYVAEHWFPPLLDIIYDQYMELEATVVAVMEAMGKASD